MDPSRTICQVVDSFNNTAVPYSKIVYSVKEELGSPRTRRNKILDGDTRLKIAYDKISYDKIDLPLDIASSDIASLEIKSDVFNKNDLILANIDAVYNFSGQEDGYLNPQNTKDFDFVSLDGEYLTYLQYRLPASRGFTLKAPNIRKLDDRNLNFIFDQNDIVNYVLEIVVGVDLVVSHKIDYKNNLLKALKLCKPGSSFITRVDETNDLTNLYYITALCFESFSLFKPITEDLNQPYSYIIAQGYRGNSIDWISILESEDPKISIPEDFISYINEYYKSLKNLKISLKENPVQYNTYKCKAIWNIF